MLQRLFYTLKRLFISKKAISIIAGIIITTGGISAFTILGHNSNKSENISNNDSSIDNDYSEEDITTDTPEEKSVTKNQEQSQTANNTVEQNSREQQSSGGQNMQADVQPQQQTNTTNSIQQQTTNGDISNQTQAAITENTAPEQSQPADNSLSVSLLNSSNGFAGYEPLGEILLTRLNSSYSGSATTEARKLLINIASHGMSLEDAKSKYIGKTIDNTHTVTNIEYYECLFTMDPMTPRKNYVDNSEILNNQPSGLYCQYGYGYRNSKTGQCKLARVVLYLS